MHQEVPATIDFTDTKRMWSDGTLLLRAELCRILKITDKSIPIKCIPPKNRKVSEVLKQVGIYRLLKHKSKVKPTYADVVNWKVATGTGADGRKYDEILGHYDGIIPETMANGLYLGLTEAMTNCHHHAYLWPREDGFAVTDESKDWWMFSQEKDSRLSVVFCDLGVGIPATLPITRPSLWKRIVSLGRPSDGDVIEQAIKDSRTRTGKHYRGKGLRQLVDSIEEFEDSVLYIASNQGVYKHASDGSVNVETFKDSILGTLISWSVPLDKKGISHG